MPTMSAWPWSRIWLTSSAVRIPPTANTGIASRSLDGTKALAVPDRLKRAQAAAQLITRHQDRPLHAAGSSSAEPGADGLVVAQRAGDAAAAQRRVGEDR